jgi:ATP diphosphatase
MTPSKDISRLIEIMAALRTPGSGCPWDLEQTFRTIAPYTIEEAYEVADAIERGDLADLKDELGDLLLQVVYHARMAEEEGAFQFGDVVRAITAKMIRRHPHVFGDETARDAGAVKAFWEKIKAEEKAAKSAEEDRLRSPGAVEASTPLPSTGRGRGCGAERGATAGTSQVDVPRPGAETVNISHGPPPTSHPSPQGAGVSVEQGPTAEGLLKDVTVALPALTRAVKLQDKAAKVGFDWPSLAPVFAKLKEEIGELEEVAFPAGPSGAGDAGPEVRAEIEEEFGDLLFVVANVARHLRIDPEAALRGANQKFIRRFRFIEERLAERGKSPADSNLAEMDALWDEAKARERAADERRVGSATPDRRSE